MRRIRHIRRARPEAGRRCPARVGRLVVSAGVRRGSGSRWIPWLGGVDSVAWVRAGSGVRAAPARLLAPLEVRCGRRGFLRAPASRSYSELPGHTVWASTGSALFYRVVCTDPPPAVACPRWGALAPLLLAAVDRGRSWPPRPVRAGPPRPGPSWWPAGPPCGRARVLGELQAPGCSIAGRVHRRRVSRSLPVRLGTSAAHSPNDRGEPVRPPVTRPSGRSHALPRRLRAGPTGLRSGRRRPVCTPAAPGHPRGPEQPATGGI